VKTKSNLGAIDEDAEYDSAEDSDYDEDGDDVSELSDDFTYDTVSTAFESKAFKDKKAQEKKKRAAVAKATKETGKGKGKGKGGKVADLSLEPLKLSDTVKEKTKIYGNTEIGLPFILDLWRDCLGKARVSAQVHLLSGKDQYLKVLIRVSTDQKDLVLTLPMSPYMSRSDFAFNTFLLASSSLTETDLHYMKILLKHHPKIASRMVAVSKIKGRSSTEGFFYEQRIRLPRTCNYKFASKEGCDMFHGKKFVEYPDGSVFLHVELLAETKDNYVPEERLLDPSMMKTVPKTVSTAMDVDEPNSGARVLSSDEASTTSAARQPSKRARRGGSVVVEDSSQAGDDDGKSLASDAETMFKQPNPAYAKAAREKAASVLDKAEQQAGAKSSLAAAAAEGRAQAMAEDEEEGQ